MGGIATAKSGSLAALHCVALRWALYVKSVLMEKLNSFPTNHRFLSLSLLQETASGLKYIHSVGVIHRDVKPNNVLIGGGNTAKLADYGISRVANTSNTMTSVGTPIYTAPEVLRGDRYGFEADVYSFGLTIYSLCDRVSNCPCQQPTLDPISTHTQAMQRAV